MKHDRVKPAAAESGPLLFDIAASDLRRAVQRLNPAYDARFKIPVLGNALIEASPDGVAFSTTDLDLMIRVDVAGAEVIGAGRITVPMKTLDGFSRAATGSVRVNVEPGRHGDVLCCVSDDLTMRLNLIIPPEDWPVLQVSPPVAQVTMPVSKMHRLVRMARHCISLEETRYYLNGIYLHQISGTMRAVATDGYRLAVIDSDVPWAGPAFIVPRRACEAIAALWPKGTDDDLTYAATAPQPPPNEGKAIHHVSPRFTVRSGDTTLTSKVIDGTYPDYTRVIPAKLGDCGATVQVGQLARLGFASSERSRACIFTPATGDEKGSVLIGSNSGDGITARVPADVRGPAPFGINWKYLMQQGGVTPVMRLDGGGPGDPLKITADNPDAFWVVMPMRV